jgi:regulator of sigma E protease
LISGNDQPIHNYDELRQIVDANENKPVVFLVDRKGQQVELTVTPRRNTELDRIMIGVGLGVPFRTANSWTETLDLGARYAYINIRTLISLPAQMLRGTLAPEQGRLIGLKGIYDIFEQTVSHDVQATTSAPVSADPIDRPIRTLDLIASLSISLGIFNLFPFPALDGGRILFVLPEIIFRRRVPHRFENLVHGLGMALLLMFMIYVNVMDFINPVNIPIP